MAIVVMGVSGAGKTLLGTALADALAVPFRDADDLHPPGNIARMAAGMPLTDADRAPWLDRVAAWLNSHADGVVACSALRRRYRDRLRRAAPGLRFVLPLVPEAVLRARVEARQGHFMPARLLADQLATLEMPDADEAAIVVDGTLPVAAQLALLLPLFRKS